MAPEPIEIRVQHEYLRDLPPGYGVARKRSKAVIRWVNGSTSRR